MQVRILFFAQLRDITKTAEAVIELPDRSSVEDLKQILPQKYPGLDKYLATLSYAIDNEYVSGDQLLKPECSVALIPPISGG